MRKILLTLFCMTASAMSILGSELTAGLPFTNHMILQRGQPCPVWGTATKNSTVTVIFGKAKVKTKANNNGYWKVILPAQPASFEGKSLRIASGKERIELQDVVVGEVWVAAGQSNMEYTMRLYKTFQKPYKGEDLAAIELTKPANPNIRLYTCPNSASGSSWAYAGGEAMAKASAPGYFFAKHLQDSLQVPVGIITTAVGGTTIEQWYANGTWYKKKVEPYVPYAVKGFLWYQGENNCTKRERKYATKFRQMVSQWRTVYGVTDAPFLTVMLAPHIYTNRKHRAGLVDAEELPRFRMQQMECLDSVSHTEIIFNPDLVDDLADIHHSYKWIVGQRLSALALNKVYGHDSLEWSGPRMQNVTLVKDGKDDSLLVSYSHIGEGLKGPESGIIRWFEVAGADGVWHSAIAELVDRAHVRVYSYEVSHPVQIRYLWHETAASTDLRNSLGLCAFPWKSEILRD